MLGNRFGVVGGSAGMRGKVEVRNSMEQRSRSRLFRRRQDWGWPVGGSGGVQRAPLLAPTESEPACLTAWSNLQNDDMAETMTTSKGDRTGDREWTDGGAWAPTGPTGRRKRGGAGMETIQKNANGGRGHAGSRVQFWSHSDGDSMRRPLQRRLASDNPATAGAWPGHAGPGPRICLGAKPGPAPQNCHLHTWRGGRPGSSIR